MDEAKKSIIQSVSIWQSQLEAGDKDAAIPPYPFRISTAKILTELKEYEKAFDVLERLVREDDEVVEVWYLMGWVYYLCEEMPAAKDCLENALRVSQNTGCDDEQLVQHINELLAELENVQVETDDMDDDNNEMDEN